MPLQQAAAVTPVTVGTSSASNPSAPTSGRFLCRGNGYWFAFYNDGTNYGFKSSSDGITWGSFTSIRAQASANSIAWSCDASNNVYYAFASGNPSFKFRYGALNNDGTITWTVSEASITTTHGSSLNLNPSIRCTSTTNCWVSLETFDGTTIYLEVFKCQTSSCGTAANWANKDSISQSSDVYSIILPLSTTSKTAVWYGIGGSSKANIVTTSNGGTSWTGATATTNNYSPVYCEGVSVSDTSYFGCMSSISSHDQLIVLNFPLGGSWTETSLQTFTSNTIGPVTLSTDSGTNMAMVYQNPDTLTELDYRTSTNTGSSWSSSSAFVTGESNIITGDLNMPFGYDGSTLGAAWSISAVSSVRFASLSLTVTQPITCKLKESGAPNENVTLSGGSPIPSVITCSAAGTTTNVSVNPSVTVTATVQAAASNSRYLGNASWTAGTSFSFSSCGSGTCGTKILYNYYQLQNTYKATPTSPTLFDVAKTLPVNGTILGASNTNICNIVTANGGGGVSCSGWADFNLTASFPSSFTISGHTWATGNTVSFQDTTGGNTHNANFREVFMINAYYSISDILGGCAAPILSYTYNGTLHTLTLTTSPVSTAADLGTSWSTTNPIVASGSERCIAKTGASGTITLGQPIAPAYEHQWLVTFSLSGVNPYQVPVTVFHNGTNVIVNENNSPSTQWAKGGTQVVLSNPVAINAQSQLYTYNPTSYTILAATTISNLYFVQSIVPPPAGNCIETNTCPPMLPLDFLVFPYKSFMGDFALPIIWGAVMTFLYVKTENAMLVLGVGVGILAGMYQFVPSVLQASSTSIIFFWAISAAGVGVGCTLFYLYKHKVQQP